MAVSVALAVSVGMLLLLFADLFSVASEAVGSDPDLWSALASAAMFLGLLAMPTVWSVIVWPIHLRQKRRGEKVFGWLRFVVLASSLWMVLVYVAIQRL